LQGTGMGRVFYVKAVSGVQLAGKANQIMYIPPFTCRVSPVT
ncbi:MAG: hypothetical protein RL261_2457, partial [Pseudomonadota bacterium]